MTHTQVCENAMNRECFCDCNGSLHGRNPKRGVVEMKEGYQSNPNDNKEESSPEFERRSFHNLMNTDKFVPKKISCYEFVGRDYNPRKLETIRNIVPSNVRIEEGPAPNIYDSYRKI